MSERLFDQFFNKFDELFDHSFFRKPEDAGEEVENIETSIPFSDVNSVLLKNINGSVRILTWEKPEVYVKATKKVKFRDAQRGEEYAKNVKVNVDKVGDRIEIVTSHPKGDTPRYIKSVSVEYDISMPQKANLEASTLNGNVSVGGISGWLKASTLNGSVVLNNIHGSLGAKTTNGNINAKISFLEGGGEFQTVNGSIDVLASEANLVPINAQTVNGSISLKIPSNFAANLEAGVVNGSINCELPVSVQGKLDRRSLKGKLNGGGEEMKVKTVNGNIAISSQLKAKS